MLRRLLLDPLEYLRTAHRLATFGRKPRSSDLRRAVSTTYYAMFDALCRTCADSFVGGKGADRDTDAWLQVYRSVDHGQAKQRSKNQEGLAAFPTAVRVFAEIFCDLQIQRHEADYNPMARFHRNDVLNLIDIATTALRDFNRVPVKDRRAFAVWIAVKDRRT